MPSTYSTNLALTLMATGEQSGAWGGITNTNLGTLLEQAITATGTVVMADANQTIAMTQGATATARCFLLDCTGALTAQRNLVVPTIFKPYIVTNSTTGGFGVQVKTSAGTGIVVAPGERRFLYADGTNVVEMLNAFTSLMGLVNLTLTGTLTGVTGTFSGTLSAAAGTFSGAVTGASFNKIAIVAPATGATMTISNGKSVAFSNSVTFAGTDGTTQTFPPATASIGYLNIPQNSQATSYTTVLGDSGKQLLHPAAASTAATFTIDSNANVAYAVGSALTFINEHGAGTLTIAITSDTMRLAGAGTTGSRTLAADGIATAVKVTTTSWLISGVGLT